MRMTSYHTLVRAMWDARRIVLDILTLPTWTHSRGGTRTLSYSPAHALTSTLVQLPANDDEKPKRAPVSA